MDNNTADPNEKQLMSVSKNLYVFAWIVEIIAVIIGLAISLAVAYSGYKALTTGHEADLSTYLNVLVAASPLFLIAVVELTKIPLSGAAYYASRWYWRGLFTAALFFVALITFETMFNGLERQFSALKYTIDTKMDTLTHKTEKRTDLIARRDETASVTLEIIENDFNGRTATLQTEFDIRTNAIDEKYSDEKASTVNEFNDMLRQEVQQLNAQLTEVRNRQGIELGALQSNSLERDKQKAKARNNEANVLQNQYKSISTTIERLTNQRNELGFFKGTEKEDLQKKINRFESERRMLSQRLNNLVGSKVTPTSSDRDQMLRSHRAEISVIESKLADSRKKLALSVADMEDGRERLNKQITYEKGPIVAEFEAQRREAVDMRDRRLEDLENREETIAVLNTELNVLGDEITRVRSEINQEGRANQVYRMAAMAFNKDSTADLTPSEIGIVAAIWFGSLAAIIAFTGILLALGSYALRTPKRLRSNKERTRFWRALRSLVVNWKHSRRMALLEEVEVIKEIKVEVPTDRIVDREVRVIETQFVPYPITPQEARELGLTTSSPEALKKVEALVDREVA